MGVSRKPSAAFNPPLFGRTFGRYTPTPTNRIISADSTHSIFERAASAKSFFATSR